jgi:hypothetical protein
MFFHTFFAGLSTFFGRLASRQPHSWYDCKLNGCSGCMYQQAPAAPERLVPSLKFRRSRGMPCHRVR